MQHNLSFVPEVPVRLNQWTSIDSFEICGHHEQKVRMRDCFVPLQDRLQVFGLAGNNPKPVACNIICRYNE